jgi:hypothetical protein
VGTGIGECELTGVGALRFIAGNRLAHSIPVNIQLALRILLCICSSQVCGSEIDTEGGGWGNPP